MLAVASAFLPPTTDAVGAMHAIRILGLLKYASFAVTALSAIWGLTAKTTFDDASGRKRLTAAGHVTLALIGASTLIGVASYGFETAEGSADALRQSNLEQRREQERRADILDQGLTAEERQITLLQEAKRQEDLERNTAANVSRGAAQNLVQTRAVLSDVQRSLVPIGKPDVSMTFKVQCHLESPSEFCKLPISTLESMTSDEPKSMLRPNDNIDFTICIVRQLERQGLFTERNFVQKCNMVLTIYARFNKYEGRESHPLRTGEYWLGVTHIVVADVTADHLMTSMLDMQGASILIFSPVGDLSKLELSDFEIGNHTGERVFLTGNSCRKTILRLPEIYQNDVDGKIRITTGVLCNVPKDYSYTKF